MSRSVDERIVSMQFDNQQFERNAATSMSTLEKLKQSLNFTGASKGLDNINSAAKGVNMSSLGNAVETVAAKFSALQVMGVTALANITNSAVNTGKRMISALTIDPIKTGFSEYETKMNAIQTIMSNTASKGTTMDDVTRVIGELNTYADKTIYNFAEMTRNIGTFTAAGVGLEESASAIQGIANLAAMSGSSSQQASTAMYQLSQAMASGTVKLMDWNSVVNAGMGGELFQNALKETARTHGVAVDKMIEKSGSFRESLSQGWITTDILTETLRKMTKSGAAEYLSNLTGIEQSQIEQVQKLVDENTNGTASYEELAEQMAATGKVSKEEAIEILKMADNAEDAATKVKTFTQLWDTLKESAQSGWSQTWEILIGDFEEAKETLTEISKVIGAVLEASAKARNELLQGWKDAGGRADIVDSLFNIFKAIGSVVKPIKEAFGEIFPPITVKNLKDFSEGLKKFTENLTISSDVADKVKRIFKGVFSIIDIGRKIVVSVADAFLRLAGSDGVGGLSEFLLDATASLGDFFTSLNDGFNASGLAGFMSTLVDLISDLIEGTLGPIESFGDAIAAVGGVIKNVAKWIWDTVKPVFEWIRDNVSAGDIFAGLAGGGIFVVAKKLTGFLDKIVEAIKGLFGGKDNGPSIKDKLADLLDGVKDTLNAFSTGIKIGSILAISIAVGILSAALKSISEIDVGSAIKSLTVIGAMMGMLTWTMTTMTKTLNKFDPKGLGKAGLSMILVSAAILVLASAMEKISKLSMKEIAKGLIGVGGGLIILSAGLKIIDKTKISLKTSIAMVALAKACEMLGDAMQKFATLTWDKIARGLVAMGGALLELTGVMAILQKFGGFKSLLSSIGIFIIVQSLDELAVALKSFGEMQWDEIGRSLSAMGGALGELAIALGGLGKLAGFSSIFASGAIAIVVSSLDDLAVALKSFGEMQWDEIGRGLTSMGGALLEVSGFAGALGKIAGFSAIFGAGAIAITVSSLEDLAISLKSFGEMTWDEIGRGLVAMAGALLEVAAVSGALGIFTGIAGIFGAGAIWIAVQGLDKLAVSFKKFGTMSWSEIGAGLVAMGGALLEVAAISGALGVFTGIAGIVGAGTITLAVQGLDELATALQKFGSMSWDEIGRGLAAMGGAMGEVALGSLANTFSGIGAMAIGEIVEPLSNLADSVKKWSDVTVPETLGEQLKSLASGVKAFTFGGMGAGALAEVAPAIGTLADSVKKWNGVTIPDGLPSKFDTLANAVKKFWDAGIADGTLSNVAAPFGTLADSVKKWADVTVPENIESDMKKIANGVGAFTFAFAGGWSLDSIVVPLGNLAGSIKKWVDVTVPEGIETGLKSIANGVSAFSFAFAGGWSLEAIIGPLGDLAGSVKKWADVIFPEGLGENLKSLGSGVSSFALIGDISHIPTFLNSLADSITRFSEISFGTISTDITNLFTSLNGLAVNETVIASINNLGSTITNGLVVAITNAASTMSSAGNSLIDGLITGILSKQGALQTTVVDLLTFISLCAKNKVEEFELTGIKLVDAIIKGVESKATDFSDALSVMISEAASSANDYYDSFESAGAYCVSGFVAGINNNKYKAANAGGALAAAALAAAIRKLSIASPSKEFHKIGDFAGQGFVNALTEYEDVSYKTASAMAGSAMEGLNDTISKIKSAIDSDMDVNPTIRPVLDLSNVQNGANSINRMFANRTLALAGINADHARIDSEMNLTDVITKMQKMNDDSNRSVVNAITNLRGDFGSLVEAIGGMHIRMDSGTVVGELIGKIDSGLGRIATHKGRGI